MTDESVVPTSAEDLAGRVTGVDWTVVVLLAIGTFSLGYVVTGLVVVLGPSRIEADLGTVVVLLGFVFYSAHNVPYETGLGTQDLLASPETAGQAISPAVYYAIPIVLLLAAGVVLARRATSRRVDPVETVVATLGFSLGYLCLAVLGTQVVRLQGPLGTATLVVERAVLFGLAYPLLFATIGAGIAVLGDVLRRETR